VLDKSIPKMSAFFIFVCFDGAKLRNVILNAKFSAWNLL